MERFCRCHIWCFLKTCSRFFCFVLSRKVELSPTAPVSHVACFVVFISYDGIWCACWQRTNQNVKDARRRPSSWLINVEGIWFALSPLLLLLFWSSFSFSSSSLSLVSSDPLPSLLLSPFLLSSGPPPPLLLPPFFFFLFYSGPPHPSLLRPFITLFLRSI